MQKPKLHSKFLLNLVIAAFNSAAEKSLVMDIQAALYLDKCEADGGLKIYVKATVKENGQRFASYDTVVFEKPDMKMEVKS